MDLVLVALAVACFGWAIYAQTVALPRNRAAANEFLATPHIELGEMARYSSDTVVSVTGTLHRPGASPNDWIAYVESRRERDTRASAPSEYRWVVKKVERPAELRLTTPSGSLRLIPAVEDYPLKAATSSSGGDERRLGFQDGQRATVFGRIRSYATDGSPETFAFHEIWGQDWQTIRQPYLAVQGRRTTPGILVLGLAGLGLAGACAWRRQGSAAP
jgi:hypothetical protein